MGTNSTAVFIAFSGASDHEKAFLPVGGYVCESQKPLEANEFSSSVIEGGS
jgi:hypothetical protein